MNKFVLRDELMTKAATYDAANLTPQLIRRLAAAEINDEGIVEIRTDQGIRLSGWDGITKSIQGGYLIPSGPAVWEISASDGVEAKANKDFEKRSTNPGSINRADYTYIAVTLRSWENKEKWVDEKKKRGIWKDVRAYDVDTIAGWIERWPSVASWFAWKANGYLTGILSLEQYEREFLDSVLNPFPPSILVVSRSKEVNEVKAWLNSDTGIFRLKADTREEAILFFKSVVDSLEESKKEEIFARTVVVESPDDFRNLRGPEMNPKGLIVISNFDASSVATKKLVGFSKVLLAFDKVSVVNPDTLLSLQKKEELIKCLVDNNFEKKEADRIIRSSEGHFRIFLRQLGNANVPDWAMPKDAPLIIPALLLGSWDTSNSADKVVVEKLLGKTSYVEFERTLNALKELSDSPVRRLLNSWDMVSRIDSWKLVSRFITDNDLKIFRELSEEVLGELNPAYDLAKDDRWMASLKGRKRDYSESLRKGISETLLLLSLFNNDISALRGQRIEDFVSIIIRKLFSPSWKNWASFGSSLQILAEAHPATFLDCLEISINETDGVQEMLAQRSAGAFGGAGPLAYLMWALEIVAWDEKSFPRAIMALSKLANADLDYSGNIVNGPFSSLKNIFTPYSFQSNVDKKTIYGVLETITKKYPDLSWKLHTSLVSRHGSIQYSAKPIYRYCKGFAEFYFHKDIHEFLDHSSNTLLQLCSRDEKFKLKIFDVFESYGERCQLKILNVIQWPADSSMKLKMWDEARDVLANKSRFPDADWVISDEVKNALEKKISELEPKQLSEKNKWLFDDQWPQLPEPYEDYDANNFKIEKMRLETLIEVFNTDGIDGVIQFAKSVAFPFIVGRKLNEVEQNESFKLLQTEWGDEEWFFQFYSGLCRGASSVDKNRAEEIALLLFKNGRYKNVNALVVQLESSKSTWDLIRTLSSPEISEYYWTRSYIFFDEENIDDLDYVIESLYSNGRVVDGIRILSDIVGRKKNVVGLSGEKVAKFVELAVSELVKVNLQGNNYTMSGYYLSELLSFMEKQNIPLQTLALIEWRVRPLIDGHRNSPKALFKYLGRDPELFCEMIKFLYKKDDGTTEDFKNITSEQLEGIRSMSYSVLHAWKGFPGHDDNGFNPEVFNEWMKKCNELNEKNARVNVSKVEIGSILARSPSGPNNEWPHPLIADLLEEESDETLKRNFRVGIYNKRGTVSKSLGDGGEQERSLADVYRSYSEHYRVSHPAVSRVLEQISEGYISEATQEDFREEEFDF